MKKSTGLTIAKWAGFAFAVVILVAIIASVAGNGSPSPVVFGIAAVALVVCVAGLIWNSRSAARKTDDAP